METQGVGRRFMEEVGIVNSDNQKTLKQEDDFWNHVSFCDYMFWVIFFNYNLSRKVCATFVWIYAG